MVMGSNQPPHFPAVAKQSVVWNFVTQYAKWHTQYLHTRLCLEKREAIINNKKLIINIKRTINLLYCQNYNNMKQGNI